MQMRVDPLSVNFRCWFIDLFFYLVANVGIADVLAVFVRWGLLWHCLELLVMICISTYFSFVNTWLTDILVPAGRAKYAHLWIVYTPARNHFFLDFTQLRVFDIHSTTPGYACPDLWKQSSRNRPCSYEFVQTGQKKYWKECHSFLSFTFLSSFPCSSLFCNRLELFLGLWESWN